MLSYFHIRRAQKVKIAQAISEAENGTTGEIRVHLSYAKNEGEILQMARAKFKELGMEQAKHRNGVLLYVNPRLKSFALFGDEAIHTQVQQAFWDELSKAVTSKIRERNIAHGIIHAVQEIGTSLKQYFPSEGVPENQLSNEVTESD